METWTRPEVPPLGFTPDLNLYDSDNEDICRVETRHPTLYTCGITPYDATHLGHAFTYVSADTLVRYWLAAGLPVRYAQNITDIDDPLFERAEQTQVDWRELADSQIALFRSDMDALRVVPPGNWVAVSEVLDEVEAVVRDFEARGLTYRLPNGDGSEDIYVDLTRDPSFAAAPVFEYLDLEQIFDEHGGDSTRPGKRRTLDPLVWKGVRGNDFRPAGEKPGFWRPGWHVECALIARTYLGEHITVQAGGRDLLFPHHEMSESHLREMTDDRGRVDIHFHVGMVAYQGEKKSKSLGNLVRVSELTAAGAHPSAIRLVLLANHYRSDWEYEASALRRAEARLECWQQAARSALAKPAAAASASETSAAPGTTPAELAPTCRALIDAISDDLDTPQALRILDDWAAAGAPDTEQVARAVDALLGIRLLTH